MRGGARARRVGAILAGVVALVAGVAGEARPQSGLPLPPGVVLTGPVFKQPGQCLPGSVPSITTGADANAYICSVPPTASFVPTAPAAMVVTSAPTQYVRVYCPECSPASFPNRSFMADPSTIRGLTPAQIKDLLALPSTPTMITIVTVPSGSCVLVAQGAAIPGFGSGGTAQAYAAGTLPARVGLHQPTGDRRFCARLPAARRQRQCWRRCGGARSGPVRRAVHRHGRHL